VKKKFSRDNNRTKSNKDCYDWDRLQISWNISAKFSRYDVSFKLNRSQCFDSATNLFELWRLLWSLPQWAASCKNIWRIINITVSIWLPKYARLYGHWLCHKAHSFLRASFSENCTLLGNSIRRQIFAPNGNYCMLLSCLF